MTKPMTLFFSAILTFSLVAADSRANRVENPGFQIRTIGTGVALTAESANFQIFTPSSAPQAIALPPYTHSFGRWFVLQHAGITGYNMTVNDSAGSTVVTLKPKQAVIVACNGTNWQVVFSGAAANGDTLLATGTIVGAVSQAQDFGTNGIKADSIVSSSGATTSFNLGMTDNLADGFNLKEGSNSYLKAVTANNAEQLTAAVFIQSPGCVRQTADVPLTTNTTLAALTGLSVTLKAGKTYSYAAKLFTASTASGGVKVAIAGGGASATAIITEAKVYAGATLSASTQTTSITDVVAADAASDSIEIRGTITVNAAGTFALQGAQNTSHADTTTFKAGSYLWVNLVP